MFDRIVDNNAAPKFAEIAVARDRDCGVRKPRNRERRPERLRWGANIQVSAALMSVTGRYSHRRRR